MNAALGPVDLAHIEAAAERIAPWVHRTPILTSRQLDARAGAQVLFKAEHLQRVGAFKARGAHNAVMQLDDETASRGVATHSSGNHGAALALAARNRGTRATIVMPSNAPSVKRAAIEGYGAEIVECEPNQAAREATLADVLERTGAHLVHPFEDARVICGQGTVGLEIAEQVGDAPPEVVIVPVGGGGLLAGVAVAVAGRLAGCEVIAAEPAGADDAYRSFHGGAWVPQTEPDTIADGLLTSLGHRNFELIQRHVRDVVRVSDAQVVDAMRFVWMHTKQIIEPSAAVPFAALFSDPARFAGQRVAVVASGGNVDLDRLPW